MFEEFLQHLEKKGLSHKTVRSYIGAGIDFLLGFKVQVVMLKLRQSMLHKRISLISNDIY